jgi:hypothetical protein
MSTSLPSATPHPANLAPHPDCRVCAAVAAVLTRPLASTDQTVSPPSALTYAWSSVAGRTPLGGSCRRLARPIAVGPPPSAPSSPDAVPGILGPPPILLGSTEAPASSGDDDSAPSWEGRTHFFEAWLPQGDLLLKNRLAFAFLDNPAAIPDISAFVGAALGSACPDIHVELLPSTRGVKLLRFDNNSDRERLRGLSPISFEGASLSLERPEETSNRFIRSPEWLALVALTDFPPEQWSEASIRRCFTAGAKVLEINPDCLDGHNFGPLQLVLEVNHYLDIPYEILVSEHCGLSREGSLVQVMPLRIWPRSAQLDPAGRLIPFFHHPHPPTPCCTSTAHLAIQWCSPLPLPCHPLPPSPTHPPVPSPGIAHAAQLLAVAAYFIKNAKFHLSAVRYKSRSLHGDHAPRLPARIPAIVLRSPSLSHYCALPEISSPHASPILHPPRATSPASPRLSPPQITACCHPQEFSPGGQGLPIF